METSAQASTASLPESADCVVIGGGIAGASIAAFLAPEMKVVVLEAEQQVGYHSTGRSAALYSALYGNESIRALTRASRPFFERPPAGFCSHPLLRPRSSLFLVSPGQEELAAAYLRKPDAERTLSRLGTDETLARVPVLQRGCVTGALLDATSADIDVDALQQGFLRLARSAGSQLHLSCALRALWRDGSDWMVQTGRGLIRTPLVVNAAGAWATDVAKLAGITPVPLQALRRTAAIIDAPPGFDTTDWPAVITVDESHYFKPDAGLLLISPADETPSAPCDAQPEDLDVAIAVDRFETLTGLEIPRVRHRWAGLRVFSPDRTPVVGFDLSAPGFFWCAGQGGYGIQTAPALGRVAALLALRRSLPDDLLSEGVSVDALSPARFAGA